MKTKGDGESPVLEVQAMTSRPYSYGPMTIFVQLCSMERNT